MADTNSSGHGREPEADPVEAPAVYPFPDSPERLLPWSQAAEQLAEARNYWLATARPDGRPHVAPLWGAWVDDAFYFQGAPTSRWARNLSANPSASLHLESGVNVVIVDGVVDHRLVTETDLAARLIDAWRVKYGRMEPAPATEGLFRLQPRVARGWSEGLQTAARWTFAGG